MYVPTQTAIPSYGSSNYAPVKPLLALQDSPTPQPHYIRDALKELLDHKLGLEKETWKEIYNVGQMIDLFVQGKQLVRKDPVTGIYTALTPRKEDSSTMRASNEMQFYETNCITKACQSDPDIFVRPAKGTDEARAAARGGQVVCDHYGGRFYQPEYTQKDWRLAFRFGTAISRVRYDPGAAGIVVYRELAEQRTIQIGDGLGYCGTCQYEGDAPEFAPPIDADQMPAADGPPPQQMVPSCPECGSSAVMVTPPQSLQVPSVSQVQPVQMGDLVCDSLPLAGCKWDMSQTPENSSWFIYQQSQDMHAIRSILGNIRMPDSDDENFGLKILAALATSGQAISGHTWRNGQTAGELYREKRTITEAYFSPDDYGDIPVKGDEQTLGGQQLQAGTLDKTFPDGCVSVWLNNTILLGLYAENHRRLISSHPWFMKPLSGVGRGAGDMVEVQKRKNVTDSQILAYWRSSATPAYLYDQDLMEGDNVGYIGHPLTSTPVNTSRLAGDNRTIKDAIWQSQPAPVPGAFIQYSYQHLDNMMQIAAHITDFSGGLPGVNNETATGAQILDSNANAIWTPMLQLNGSARKRQMETVLYLYPKHFPMTRDFPLGGDYSQAQGIALQGADLDTELWLEVARNSEQPRSPYIRRANLKDYMLAIGGIQGVIALKQSDPQMFEETTKWWDLDFETGANDSEHVAQLCNKRINQLTQAMEQKALNPALLIKPEQIPPPKGIKDPMQMQAVQAQMAQQLAQEQQAAVMNVLIPPVSPLEPAQHEKALKLQNWLDTDSGQEAQPILRAAVEQLVMLHFQYAGNQGAAAAQQAGQTTLAGEAPKMAADFMSQTASKQQDQAHAGEMQDKKAVAEKEKAAAKPQPLAKKAKAKK